MHKKVLEALNSSDPFADVDKMIHELNSHRYGPEALSSWSVLNNEQGTDEERNIVQQKYKNNEFTPEEDRALAIMVANAIGDSLGAPLEFSPVKYDTIVLNGYEDTKIWSHQMFNTFGLKPGQWTDDFSMANCLAESLLVHDEFAPIDLRLRFACWWTLGYCNAFGFSDTPRHSVGLGGNISLSFREFMRDPSIEYTRAGDLNTSGNGSVMRNSPVPTRYARDINKAMEIAYKQSKTTHQGDEAAELCRLLTFVCIKGIETGDKDKVLEALHNEFTTDLYSVKCLAQSKQEEECDFNKGHKMKDRNWNWKEQNFRFSPTRADQSPGYIGSYAMDAVAMALHCVYSTNNFKDAVVKCVNLRGDSDSHGAVCAQIAGAIYGLASIPKHWVETVQQWDRKGDIMLKAYKLYHKDD